jgi:hypothetical protein
MSHRSLTASERWHNETREYTDRLLASAQSSPRFAGAEFKFENRELIVFAVGIPSEAVAALIREAPANIRVTWQESPYSHAELNAEVRRLMDQEPALRLTTGGAPHDGTCIDFTTTDVELLSADDPQTMLGARYPVAVAYGGLVQIR